MNLFDNYDTDVLVYYFDNYCDLVEYFDFEDFNDYLDYVDECGDFYE